MITLSLVLQVLLLCVLCWAVVKLMAVWSVPQPIQGTVYVLLVVVVVIWLIGLLGGSATTLIRLR